jgi:uncharacterized protein YueI
VHVSSQIKLRTHKIAYGVRLISNRWKRTQHQYILCFMIPIAANPNKQQDHIHVQSCSCIRTQSNTFHLKTCFNFKSILQYIRLLTLSHQIANRLQEKTISKFKTIDVSRSKQYHDINSNNCTQEQENIFINIRYSVFRPTLAIIREVENISKCSG